MKKLIYIALLGLFFIASCDDTTDYWYEINDNPSLTIRKYNNGSYIENLYDSLKLGFGSYKAQYRVIDTNETTVDFNYVQGLGSVEINDVVNTFTIETDSLGVQIIDFNATDILGKTGKARLTLEVFENLPPVCEFTTSLGSNYTVVVDASASYDQDSKFGGQITKYKFSSGNYTSDPINLSTFNLQFSNAGAYNITVWVQDNNGIWSEENTQTVNVL
jgi:hypothetical protein